MDVRLRQALARAEEVARALADPAVAADSAKLQSLGREHARLQPVVRAADLLARGERELADAEELAAGADAEMAALAAEEVTRLRDEVHALREELAELLVPRDPHDDRDAILEIRAGTGGDEA
ncbi:MAG TPA: PCRF domain-containing protein, partial [Gemmatimonadales bacterium]|nr:PCRF domain-containing protein [Gemmatimonadales bacterium]